MYFHKVFDSVAKEVQYQLREIPMKNKPVLEKCLAFMSCFNPEIKTFEDFRNWVIANHKPAPDPMAGRPYGPYTSWEYQVPFLSDNSSAHRVCVTPFEDKYTEIVTTRADEVFKMKLVHGFICSGCWHGCNYGPFLPNEKSIRETDGVYEKTIGAELYYSIDRPSNSKVNAFYQNLVIVGISLRVNNKNEIVCIFIIVKTHIHEHRDGTDFDESYIAYNMTDWWGNKSQTENIIRNSKDEDLERYIHSEILTALIKELSE